MMILFSHCLVIMIINSLSYRYLSSTLNLLIVGKECECLDNIGSSSTELPMKLENWGSERTVELFLFGIIIAVFLLVSATAA